MWQIKICGLRHEADVVSAFEAGADAIGLNFYPQSKRFVAEEQARALTAMAKELRATRQSVHQFLSVGVFVNRPIDEVAGLAKELSLNAVQLHGEETAEDLADLSAVTGGVPVVRAIRHPEDPLAAAAEFVESCRKLNVLPAGILLDAYDPDQPGGTGKRLHWQDLVARPAPLHDIPLILAGGLTAENVAAAIAAARPNGVDVAGGVESAPGIKDSGLISQFVTAAKQAFGSDANS